MKPTKEQMYKWYVEERKSYREIMKIIETKNNRKIKKLLDKYGIKPRGGSEAVKTQWENNPERRNRQAQLIKKISEGNHFRRLSEKEIEKRCEEKGFKYIDRWSEDGIMKIKYKCLKCNNVGIKDMRNFYDKGCGVCEKSKGEDRIKSYLKKRNIDFHREFSFDNCRDTDVLRFDFAVFKDGDLKCLIEYQGRQHFKPINFFGSEEGLKRRQKRDNIKRKYCRKNNIPLIEIKYWSLEIIEEVLDIRLSSVNGYNKNLSLF
ncbi:MAG: DUF2726 domain-containing protein [Firmicutes bacterium]|nr:DUF2726 domain-containing protein [Bacillota bacterium]